MSSRRTDDEELKLFRQEALDAQRAQQYGEIVLLPGAWSRWMALAALALVLMALALVTLGTYTRRSTVQGQLMPSEGLIRVTVAQAGVVVERRVTDGQQVQAGDLLFVVSGDRAGPDAQAYQQVIARQIEARRQSLEDDLRRLSLAEEQEAAQLRRRLESLSSERAQLRRQEQLQEQRVKGAEDAAARYQALARQGYSSRDELLVRESELAEARTRLQGQRREGLALEREMGTVQRDTDALRVRVASQRAELQRAILQANQEFTELEARRRVVVAAPAAGRVTLLQADVGQSVDAQKPLAHLVPAHSPLVARLYVPSRSAGFVKTGTSVLLRYDAYPHQNFGQQKGQVASVSAAAVATDELQVVAPRVATPAENLFAVTVTLPSQIMGSPERPLPLQVGMRLEADLLHETRPLYEWILQPLFAATTRTQGS
jgi:membrane fusion protein